MDEDQLSPKEIKVLRGRFLAIPKGLLTRTDMSSNEKLVYAQLLDHCGDKNSCYPKQRTLAKELGMTVFVISRTLSVLEKKEFFTKKMHLEECENATGRCENATRTTYLLLKNKVIKEVLEKMSCNTAINSCNTATAKTDITANNSNSLGLLFEGGKDSIEETLQSNPIKQLPFANAQGNCFIGSWSDRCAMPTSGSDFQKPSCEIEEPPMSDKTEPAPMSKRRKLLRGKIQDRRLRRGTYYEYQHKPVGESGKPNQEPFMSPILGLWGGAPEEGSEAPYIGEEISGPWCTPSVMEVISYWNARSGATKHRLPNNGDDPSTLILGTAQYIKNVLSGQFFSKVSSTIQFTEIVTVNDIKEAIEVFREMVVNPSIAPSDKTNIKQTTLARFFYNDRADFSYFIKCFNKDLYYMYDNLVPDKDQPYYEALKHSYDKHMRMERDYTPTELKKLALGANMLRKKMESIYGKLSYNTPHIRSLDESLMADWVLEALKYKFATNFSVGNLCSNFTYERVLLEYLRSKNILPPERVTTPIVHGPIDVYNNGKADPWFDKIYEAGLDPYNMPYEEKIKYHPYYCEPPDEPEEKVISYEDQLRNHKWYRPSIEE